jgi:hypothetical protein
MDPRTLVLAVGSNASPQVMAQKFKTAGVSTVIPFVECTISGISVGHSAHVSKRGYIAATPYDSPGAVTTLMTLWLDQDQLMALDKTEPNYKRVRLQSSNYDLLLENGEQPSDFFIYCSDANILADGGSPLPFRSQRELHHWLRRDTFVANELGDGSDDETIARLCDPDRRLRLREHWATEGHTLDAGLRPADDTGHITYVETPSLEPPTVSGKGWLRCMASANDLVREGEACVVVNPSMAKDLDLAEHAVLRPSLPPHRPGVLARVVTEEKVADGVILVDQTLRNSLGTEQQEYVLVSPAKVPPHRLADKLLSKPRYILTRVQPADLVTTEQNACLLSPLAMSLLGLSDGDNLVIEGIPNGNNQVVPERRMRAHVAPESLLTRREDLSGGSFITRFPSASDALGVYPDLAWIFLDAANREQAGLGSSKLAVVRLRASRRFQLMRELRELLLLLVLAFIGIATAVKSKLVLLIVPFIIIGMVVVIRSRLRQRLGGT